MKAKEHKKFHITSTEIVGKIIVFGLTMLMLIAMVTLIVLAVWGFVWLMKGVINGF